MHAADERLAKMLQQAEVAAASARQGGTVGTASQQPASAPPSSTSMYHMSPPRSAPQWPTTPQSRHDSPSQAHSHPPVPPSTVAGPMTAPTHAPMCDGNSVQLPGPRNTQPVPPGWDPYADMPVCTHSSSRSSPQQQQQQQWQRHQPDQQAAPSSGWPHAQQPAWEPPDPSYTHQLNNAAFSPRDTDRAAAAQQQQQPQQGSGRHTADDAAVAQQLQAQLDLEAGSHAWSQQHRDHDPHAADIPRQPPPPRQQPSAAGPLRGAGPLPRGADGGQVCAGCGQPMGAGMWSSFMGGSRRIEALGQHWHPDCFRWPCRGMQHIVCLLGPRFADITPVEITASFRDCSGLQILRGMLSHFACAVSASAGVGCVARCWGMAPSAWGRMAKPTTAPATSSATTLAAASARTTSPLRCLPSSPTSGCMPCCMPGSLWQQARTAGQLSLSGR